MKPAKSVEEVDPCKDLKNDVILNKLKPNELFWNSFLTPFWVKSKKSNSASFHCIRFRPIITNSINRYSYKEDF